MAITLKRQERETTGALLRRFSRRMQSSGVLLKARKIRFYHPPKSKREQRLSALYRNQVRKLRIMLEKLGITEEEDIERAVQKFKQQWRSEH